MLPRRLDSLWETSIAVSPSPHSKIIWARSARILLVLEARSQDCRIALCCWGRSSRICGLAMPKDRKVPAINYNNFRTVALANYTKLGPLVAGCSFASAFYRQKGSTKTKNEFL